MSFSGAIGQLMAGSGLQDVLVIVFAENSVSHILSGKAIARAIHGHFLADAALKALLIFKVYNIPIVAINIQQDDQNDEAMNHQPHGSSDDLVEVQELLQKMMVGENNADDMNTFDALKWIADKLSSLKVTLNTNITSKLWIQYMELLDILRLFLKAECTRNWVLYLRAYAALFCCCRSQLIVLHQVSILVPAIDGRPSQQSSRYTCQIS